MEINLNVMMSIATRRKLCENEEWGQLMEAEEFLLADVCKKFEEEHPDMVYDVYSPATSSLMSHYLLETHPEIEPLYNLIAPKTTDNPFAVMDAFRSSLPEKYEIQTIPADYQVEPKQMQ